MFAAISKTVPFCSAVGALAVIALLILVGKVPLRYTFRNLTVRWRATLLTSLVFTLVTGLFTVMLAFVNGMYQLTDGSGQAGNVIILSDGATDELYSGMGPSDVDDVENQRGIVWVQGGPLASKEAYLVVNQPIPRAPKGHPCRFLQLRGIVDVEAAARVHAVNLYPGGKWFSLAGVEAAPAAAPGAPRKTYIQCVLGEGIAGVLGRDRSPAELARAKNPLRLEAGDAFAIGQYQCRVVGVMQSAGRTLDSEVWAKQSLIGPLFGKSYYTAIVVRTPDAQTAQEVKQFFTRDYHKTALQAEIETDYYASLANTNAQFLYAIVFVTFVMSIGGVFGVMNTMFAAVSQRIKDIGVLRLLGFSRGQILIAFVMESLAIALLGGALGVALGSLVDGLSATSVVNSGFAGGKSIVLRLTVDAGIVTGGLAMALAMGALGGLFPALAAVRLPALDALR